KLFRMLIGVGALICSLILGIALVQPDKVFSQTRPAMTGLISLLLAALFCAWKQRSVSERVLANMLTLLVIIELGTVVGYYYVSREQGWDRLEQFSQVNDIVDFLRRQPQPVRVGVDRTAITFNFGDLFGIDQFNGYSGVTE